MTQNEINKIISEHGLWLKDKNLGKRADVRGVDLSCVNLRYADLRGANLRYANLNGVDIRDANLRGVDLSCVDLSGVKLRDANLRYANLNGANLRDANLSMVDLRGADLRDVDLSGSNLSGANLNGASGFDVAYKTYIKCKFFVGVSREWDIITMGCKTHTTMEWVSYLESGEDLYLDDCYNKDEYDKCIDVLKEMIDYIEGGVKC